MHVVLEDDRVEQLARQQRPPGLAVAERQRRLGLGKNGPWPWIAPGGVAARAEAASVDSLQKDGFRVGASEFGLHPGPALWAAGEVDDVDGNHVVRPGSALNQRRSQTALRQRVKRRAHR